MLDDEQIRARGGTEEDIEKYAHDVGYACGAIYGGTCDYCGKTDNSTAGRLHQLNNAVSKLKRELLEALKIKELARWLSKKI